MADFQAQRISPLLVACEVVVELCNAIKRAPSDRIEYGRLSKDAKAFADLLMQVS